MSGTITSIARKAGGNGERSALAAAILKAQQAGAAVERLREAVDRAEEQVAASDQRLVEAAAAIGKAREQHAGALADAASTGKSPAANNALRAARLAQADAEDELEAAKMALTQLKKGGLGEVEQAAAEAETAVSVEVAKVLRPAGEELLERARKARAEFLACYQAALALTEDDEGEAPLFANEFQGLKARDQRCAPLVELRAGILKLNLTVEDWTSAKAAAEPWLRARAALRFDADAGLPT